MLVIKKRSIIIVSVLLATIFTFVLCVGALYSRPVDGLADKVKIVLDAGHGGIDAGVSGVKTGVTERELNLKVVKKLEKYFLSAGMDVVLTRNSDAGLYGVAKTSLKRKDMEKRRDIIKKEKPALVISIHMNQYSVPSRRGAQVFYKEGDSQSKVLAENIQQSFNSMDSAVKKYSPLKGDYYILNCHNYPAIIAECGFLSSPLDEALLITDEYQESIAYAIFKGTISYFSVSSFNYFN